MSAPRPAPEASGGPLEGERDGLGLIETARASGGEVPLLHLHIARLSRSAAALGFRLDPAAVEAALRAAAEHAHARGPAARLRLVLRRDGSHEIAAAPLAGEAWTTAAVYPEPLAEAGTWRCAYKTTARAHYDRALAWAAGVGADEPILLNARGEVTEGARSNVFVRRGKALLTPPLAAGGLGGVMRQRLLAEGAEEVTLTPEDLRAADAILLTNAVRGAMPVDLLSPAA